MSTSKVNFRLPEELIKKAVVPWSIFPTNRPQDAIDSLREYLEAIEDTDAFKEDIVELYLDGQIGFETLREFIGRQDAESVRASKTLLDQGDELADSLAELP